MSNENFAVTSLVTRSLGVHQGSSISGENWLEVAIALFMHTQQIQGPFYCSGPRAKTWSVPLKGMLLAG